MQSSETKRPVELSDAAAEHDTVERAEDDLRDGKSASTAAGEFVREEIEHVREGKHGARSAKQAIAIGLSKARRAGVPLSAPKRGQTSERTRKSAKRELAAAPKRKRPSAKRSRAAKRALKRESHASASHKALSTQAKRAAAKRRTAANSRKPRRWSKRVTETSDAMDIQPEIFKRGATAIAKSVKRSAERSKRRKSSPYRSAMSMLTFYENRAGKNLSARKRHTLERAKDELRKLFGRA